MNIDWGAASKHDGSGGSPGFRLWISSLAWQRRLNAALTQFDLTQPQFSTLAVVGWLTRSGEGVSQREIADFSRMERMHVSKTVRALEAAGLIIREASPDDARALRVALTTTGADRLAETLPAVEACDEDFFRSPEWLAPRPF